ncbi:MAG: tRNA 2-thiocytidine biosynthesis protein TtcA [Firmicutes bacterium]|nr:tRNA 2-thiocytidine biosynthesis protein TtcA [Bacillota bacterium]
MSFRIPRPIIKRIWRAVIEFDLLSEGDRVLIGVSGGKDSAFLLRAMKVIADTAPFHIDLGAIHIDLGFERNNLADIARLCQEAGVELLIEHTQIAEIALNHHRQNPCAQCAYFRRGVLNRTAVREGYNKVAYGHHLDDVVITFLMSQLYSGHLRTFLPKTVLDRSGITVIRPLVYLREHEIIKMLKQLDFTPIDSPCPLDGNSKRAETAKLIHELTRNNPYIFSNIAAAMREGAHVELWPRQLSKEEMHTRHRQLMGQQERINDDTDRS